MQAFEIRDVYKPHRPNSIVRLELVSAHFTHCLIDALKDTLLAFPVRDMFAHFTVGGLGPLRSKLNTYI
jgi:hypothetical protein